VAARTPSRSITPGSKPVTSTSEVRLDEQPHRQREALLTVERVHDAEGRQPELGRPVGGRQAASRTVDEFCAVVGRGEGLPHLLARLRLAAHQLGHGDQLLAGLLPTEPLRAEDHAVQRVRIEPFPGAVEHRLGNRITAGQHRKGRWRAVRPGDYPRPTLDDGGGRDGHRVCRLLVGDAQETDHRPGLDVEDGPAGHAPGQVLPGEDKHGRFTVPELQGRRRSECHRVHPVALGVLRQEVVRKTVGADLPAEGHLQRVEPNDLAVGPGPDTEHGDVAFVVRVGLEDPVGVSAADGTQPQRAPLAQFDHVLAGQRDVRPDEERGSPHLLLTVHDVHDRRDRAPPRLPRHGLRRSSRSA
jgi:hypothetical protein